MLESNDLYGLTCKMELAAYVISIAAKLPKGFAVLKTSEEKQRQERQLTDTKETAPVNCIYNITRT